MRISVVIPTLGRRDHFEKVFRSIDAQEHRPVQVIVVNQGGEAEKIRRAAEPYAGLDVVVISSDRGASKARNAGVAAAADVDIIGFLDDDCLYAPSALSEAVKAFESPDVGATSGRLMAVQERVQFGEKARDIDTRTVWTHAIEATTFVRASVLAEVGPFDECLGIGCPTPWQSGEGTDLLIRIIRAGHRVTYSPSIVVHELQEPVASAQWITKVRAYARGTGRVYRRHYGLLSWGRVVAAPLVAAIYAAGNGRREEAARKVQASIGRLEGLLGRLLSA